MNYTYTVYQYIYIYICGLAQRPFTVENGLEVYRGWILKNTRNRYLFWRLLVTKRNILERTTTHVAVILVFDGFRQGSLDWSTCCTGLLCWLARWCRSYLHPCTVERSFCTLMGLRTTKLWFVSCTRWHRVLSKSPKLFRPLPHILARGWQPEDLWYSVPTQRTAGRTKISHSANCSQYSRCFPVCYPLALSWMTRSSILGCWHIRRWNSMLQSSRNFASCG